MKYYPTRMCVVCRKRDVKENFIKIIKNEQGFVISDGSQIPGRGYYVCNNFECVDKLCKKQILNKVARTNVDDEIYSKLKEKCNGKN